MNRPQGHHAKWNKLDRERQIPYDLSYMWNLKKIKIIINLKTQAHRNRENFGGWKRQGVGYRGNGWTVICFLFLV